MKLHLSHLDTNWTVQEFIGKHSGPDWMVILIHPGLRATIIQEGSVRRGVIEDDKALAGIHVRDLLVAVDFAEHPEWIETMVRSITPGENHFVIHHTQCGA